MIFGSKQLRSNEIGSITLNLALPRWAATQVDVTMPTTPLNEIHHTGWRTQIFELLSVAFTLTTFCPCLSLGG